eukprot:11220201-Lingulodinium_polyedra.AAC.1
MPGGAWGAPSSPPSRGPGASESAGQVSWRGTDRRQHGPSLRAGALCARFAPSPMRYGVFGQRRGLQRPRLAPF